MQKMKECEQCSRMVKRQRIKEVRLYFPESKFIIMKICCSDCAKQLAKHATQ